MATKNNTGKVLGTIGLVVGAYFLYNKFIKKPADGSINTSGNLTSGAGTNTGSATAPALLSYYPIVYQKFNPDVKALQALLGVQQDGIIGPITLQALQPYWPATTAFKIENKGQLDYVMGLVRSNRYLSPVSTIDTGGGALSYAENGKIDEQSFATFEVAGVEAY